MIFETLLAHYQCIQGFAKCFVRTCNNIFVSPQRISPFRSLMNVFLSFTKSCRYYGFSNLRNCLFLCLSNANSMDSLCFSKQCSLLKDHLSVLLVTSRLLKRVPFLCVALRIASSVTVWFQELQNSAHDSNERRPDDAAYTFKHALRKSFLTSPFGRTFWTIKERTNLPGILFVHVERRNVQELSLKCQCSHIDGNHFFSSRFNTLFLKQRLSLAHVVKTFGLSQNRTRFRETSNWW